MPINFVSQLKYITKREHCQYREKYTINNLTVIAFI